MKSRESFLRLKRFQVEDKKRQVAQIEAMIGEFDRMAKELNDQVLAEQERSGIHDAGHFAYPTFAKAAIQRRDNLSASERALKDKLAAAKAAFDEAVAELEKAEAIAERDLANDNKHAAHKNAPEARAS
jgi:multidrug resistance efflux pump